MDVMRGARVVAVGVEEISAAVVVEAEDAAIVSDGIKVL
jgi:hypothetical protein